MELLFVDLETTGVSPRASVLEIASTFMVGDQRIGTFDTVVKPPGYLAKMEPYVLDMHTNNGLLAEVKDAPSRADVDTALYEYYSSLGREPYRLAGNSVHIDRGWIQVNFPVFATLLHHRVWELTTLKHFAQQCGVQLGRPVDGHRARPDIDASIALHFELKQKLGRIA